MAEQPADADLAQLVERNLAKVEVASSNLVSRSNMYLITRLIQAVKSLYLHSAEWQSGYAPDCKSVYLGSTPGSASIFQ